jgi:hypothetical protein
MKNRFSVSVNGSTRTLMSPADPLVLSAVAAANPMKMSPDVSAALVA